MALWNTDGTQSYFDGLSGETPTFEFRGFCWLIAYYNPDNSEYEKSIADYINLAHCGQHGGSCNIATNIFLITEELNNTPGFADKGRGRRIVAPFTYPTAYTKLPVSLEIPRIEASSIRLMTPDEKMALAEKMGIPV